MPTYYTADADIWCPPCAEARYGPDEVNRADREGNEVGAVFSWDNGPDYCPHCAACGVPVESDCRCEVDRQADLGLVA